MSDPTNLNLDQMTDEMFSRLSSAIGGCINSPEFGGFSIDEMRGNDGTLLKISFIPVDNKDGMPILRCDRNENG